MKKISLLLTLALLIGLSLFPRAPQAGAQPTLISPPNGSEVLEPPSFSWSGPYHFCVFLSFFHYAGAGYAPVYFPITQQGFPMPANWFGMLSPVVDHYWVVFGINLAGAVERSSVFSFTVTVDPCDPDPCQGIQNAVAGSCVAAGEGDFSCACDAEFAWDDAGNTCETLVTYTNTI